MKNKLEFQVQYADTDAYGVVWHGAYLRWMEQGRVEYLFERGIEIQKLQYEKNIVMPVVELDIKYKMSAKLMDKIVLETSVIELSKTSVKFLQEISLKETGKICTSAVVRATSLQNGKIMKNLDELLNGEVRE